MRVQLTLPLPVPLAVTSVVQLCFFVAFHAVDAAPVPVSVTVALSPGAALPCWITTFREAGLTASTIGTDAAVMRNVSMILAGEPLAAPGAVTVIVST